MGKLIVLAQRRRLARWGLTEAGRTRDWMGRAADLAVLRSADRKAEPTAAEQERRRQDEEWKGRREDPELTALRARLRSTREFSARSDDDAAEAEEK